MVSVPASSKRKGPYANCIRACIKDILINLYAFTLRPFTLAITSSATLLGAGA